MTTETFRFKAESKSINPHSLCAVCLKHYIRLESEVEAGLIDTYNLNLCAPCSVPYLKLAEEEAKKEQDRLDKEKFLRLRDEFLTKSRCWDEQVRSIEQRPGKHRVPVGLILPNGSVVPLEADIYNESGLSWGSTFMTVNEQRTTGVTVTLPQIKAYIPWMYLKGTSEGWF